jgi:FkbM family methyltransferase
MDSGQRLPRPMSSEEYVEALYRICLGRPADRAGLTAWTEVIRETSDPTRAFRGIIEGAEYAARAARWPTADCTIEVERAFAVVNRRLRIVDVGAQSLGAGSHPYDPLHGACELEIIGFDPLVERLRERAAREDPTGLRLVPFAVGDGRAHTLYVNNDDATSSIFPLNETHNVCFNHLSELRTVRTEQIPTRCLDDVVPDGVVDFLKLDVQGAELLVLQGADRTLSRTAVVHCEVEFSPIYLGQPLFSDVEQHLRARDFILIDLVISCRYHYLTPSGRVAEDRLLWADAVFFRETDDPATQRVQALVAASVYRKPTLAEHLLVIAERGGGSSAAL